MSTDERSAPDGADSTAILAQELLESLDTRPGATIAGRFRVEALLGRGGYGEVWRARQLRVDRLVALKLLRTDVAHRDDAARRFEREARLASRLSHPNAVRVIDFGEDRGTLFLAMDHIDGPTLRERLRERGVLPWREAAWLAMRISAALRAAHGLGLVHRDLKPANVLIAHIDGEDQPVVIDFGLAKIFDDDSPDDNITRAHAMLGTPAYMCPEVVRGAPVDGRSDLYSLGILLFELLTGRVPLRGATPLETATMHLHVAPPALGPLVPDAPAGLVVLVERLLSKQPDGRPKDADEVIATLGGLLRVSDAAIQITQPASEPVDATLLPTRRPAASAVQPSATHDVGGVDSNRSTDVRAPERPTPIAPVPAVPIPAPGAPDAPAALAPARLLPLGVAAAVVALALAAAVVPRVFGGGEPEPPSAAIAAHSPAPIAAVDSTAATSLRQDEAIPPAAPASSLPPATVSAGSGEPTALGDNSEPLPTNPAPADEVRALTEAALTAALATAPVDSTQRRADVRRDAAPETQRETRRESAAVGDVVVRVDPAGRVELAGFDAREAPATFRGVPVGRHEVRIVNGADVYTTTVEVREGERASVSHRFRVDDAPLRAEQAVPE